MQRDVENRTLLCHMKYSAMYSSESGVIVIASGTRKDLGHQQETVRV
jgi:hypothetical protein